MGKSFGQSAAQCLTKKHLHLRHPSLSNRSDLSVLVSLGNLFTFSFPFVDDLSFAGPRNVL